MASLSTSPQTYLRISDMLVDWPWQRTINPHYEEVAAEGDAWLRSFLALTPKSQRAFAAIKASLMAALVYPDVSRDQLRTCVDFLNVFFLVEEYTDVEDSQGVRRIVDVCTDALRNPSKPRPDGEVILGELMRQFWDRGRKTVPDQTGKPFVESAIDFFNAVLAQAEARDSGRVLTTEEYVAIRIDDIGVRPMYALGGAFLAIPDRLYDDPLLTKMMHLGCEIITIDNDIVSYNRERANGNADFNIVTIAMHHHSLNLDDAVQSLVEKNARLEAQYMQCLREVCSTLERRGGADEASPIRGFLDHMGNVRRGLWSWSFECGRYFGERGSTYAKTQMVPLVPEITRDTTLRENQVDILLMEEELAKL
ncbi:hypothetical protein V8D89_004560 [Ganoderma adspersum]